MSHDINIALERELLARRLLEQERLRSSRLEDALQRLREENERLTKRLLAKTGRYDERDL